MTQPPPKKVYIPDPPPTRGGQNSQLNTNALTTTKTGQSKPLDIETSSIEVQLTDANKKLSFFRSWFKFSIGLWVGTILTLLLFYIPIALRLEGFLNHPRRMTIQLLLIVIFIGVSWIIADNDKNRRWFAFGSIVLAAVFAIVQIV